MGFHRGSWSWTPGPAFDLTFQLAGNPARPRLCSIATAGGDQPGSISGFYGAFAGSEVRTSHLALFDMPNVDDTAGHLLGQDVIWVDQGSVVNLLAVWRAHGLDEILRRCWRAGVVLAGESAGSLCWHAAGTTDSYGPEPASAAGLGLLPYANAVHYQQFELALKWRAMTRLHVGLELPLWPTVEASAGLPAPRMWSRN
jgi:peptidase E